MTMQFPESIALAQLPTPIEKLTRLGNYFEGPDLYVKRDDLTGMALSGNKARKMEFVLAEALKLKSDILITCGGHQSNHARTTAVAAARHGLRCQLFLRNNRAQTPDGNFLLNQLVGAEVQFVTTEEYSRITELMQARAIALQGAGQRPYVIPEGASNGLGSLGYVKAAKEIADQIVATKTRIDHIVVAVGSGGTYAGLLLGKYLYDLPAQVHGINVCEDKDFFLTKVASILREMQETLQVSLPIKKTEMSIIDGYVGKGYGLNSTEEIDLIKKVARLEGLLLDPVYSGKAMAGLQSEIRKGHFKTGESVLFIHTGGLFGLFPKKSLFF